MASMRDIRRSIRSIQSTEQITKAMKMVSAAKLRKAQAHVVAARPYAEKIHEVLGDLTANTGDYVHPLQEKRDRKKVAYVLVSGDRGLCGGFNANIIRECEALMKEVPVDTALVAVGRKGRDYFARRKKEMLDEYIGIDDNPTFTQSKELSDKLIELYLNGTVDEIHLVFNQFRSAMSHIPTDIQLLPIEKEEVEKTEETTESSGGNDYIFEPSEVEVLETLLPAYVETLVYRALLESKASEHGARMTAMSSATDNAAEIIQSLTLTLNRARQAAITTEISEIVGGAAALQ